MPSPVPVEFLLTASKHSLQDFELSRLNHVAEMEKQLLAFIRQMAEEWAGAMVARLLIEEERLCNTGGNPLQEAFEFPYSRVVEVEPMFSAVQGRKRDAAAD